MTKTQDSATSPKRIHAGTQFALWSLCYLVLVVSVYAANTTNGNPIFRYGTDNMGWLNGIQDNDELRETLRLLFTHILPRIFDDSWTAYLILICFVLWMNGCLANLVCQALAHRYGLRGSSSASARSLAGGAAGLLIVAHNTDMHLAVNAFVYPLNCFFLLLTMLSFMKFLRTAKLRYWAVLLFFYALAAMSSSYSWLFPLVLIAIEASVMPARRLWLMAALRYIAIFILAARETTQHTTPYVEGQLDVLALFSPDILISYLSHLGAAASIFATSSNFNTLPADFTIEMGPAIVVFLVILLTCVGYVRALPFKAILSALPFILFCLWGVCSFLPLLKGADGQTAGLHRSYYNALGLALLTGAMLGVVLRLLCKRRGPALKGILYTSVHVMMVVGVVAARPSVAKGLRLMISQPLPTFPGCQQDRRCVNSKRLPSHATAGDQRDGRLTACGDASHQTLRGVYLDGKDLNRIRLTDASIQHSSLQGAHLVKSCAALTRIKDSNFDGASLAGADLSSATLTKVSLVRANLDGAVLKGTFNTEVIARQAKFRGANMFISEWHKCDFRGADMSRADLSNSLLRDSTLAGANLQGAILDSVIAAHCDFSKADLRNADMRWCLLDHANFSGADLRGAAMEGADLNGTILVGAQLEGAKTRAAKVQGATVCQQDAALLKDTRGTPKVVHCPGVEGSR